MDMTGEQLIAAPQRQVWEWLNDPEMLRTSIPGCESIEKISDTEFKIKMTAAVGPLKAKFTGNLMLEDLNPPDSYRIRFEGSGGAAGFGKGSAEVMLAPQGGDTMLSYTVAAHVGGKLAQVGSRLVDSVARKMADEFFQRFKEKIGESPPAPPEALEPPAFASAAQAVEAPAQPAAAVLELPASGPVVHAAQAPAQPVAAAFEPPASEPVAHVAEARAQPAAAAHRHISGERRGAVNEAPPEGPSAPPRLPRIWVIVAGIVVLIALAYWKGNSL